MTTPTGTTPTTRIFLARLVGQAVYDPSGDQVGKVRDVVVTIRSTNPRVLGLVVEVLGRRRIFLPMTRVTSLDGGQIITTGVLNVRRFEQRATERLVVGELFDRIVRIASSQVIGTVYDLAMEQQRSRDWFLSQVAVRERGRRFGRRGASHVADWGDVVGLTVDEAPQGATHLLETMDAMRPADLASALHDLSPKRRVEVATELGDERLADVLEELPEADQVEIVSALDPERAADVLEEMSPDDAADLIAELPEQTAERLLTLMEPDEAEDVRRLLTYEERTAGGMMTTEPVIVPADATLAEALARVREPELSPSLAAMVYVCRAPLETPTGKFLGVAHIQALLREPPSTLVSAIADNDIEWPRPESSLEDVAEVLAAYNMIACPVVDENAHLLGVVTVDDLLDHLLPKGWRDRRSADERVGSDGADDPEKADAHGT
ncbi:magnesium transporter MgtE N-terminal domain-containing protein [Solicola gregarius]|uniref:CBS domain-containing protein n=1 Tax=Solicola gregarius TaxID=2908642 RepID=A0AA46YMX3_9ACTN|nr:CBS domain-containing protein [Solicola gregarius]UYM06163.1 CBS domain-containing protein [Solicola gregarius]